MAVEAATLVVAWRAGKNVQARKVKASGTVIDFLRDIADEHDDFVAAGGGSPYDPDDEQDDKPFLTVDRADLLDNALELEMKKGASLDLIDLDDLERRRLVGYGLVLGDDFADRRVYIKRYNPVQMLRKSLVTYFNQELARLEDPILAFDDSFDVYLGKSEVVAFHQGHFEALFKETDAVLQQAEGWVQEFGNRVPLSKAGGDELLAMTRRSSVTRRKLQSILRRGHVTNLSKKDLKKALQDHQLDPADSLDKNGDLVLTSANARDVLAVLNEDLWDGYFSKAGWSATRKSQR